MERANRDLPTLSPRAVELLAELGRASTLRETVLGRDARDVAILDELRALAEPRLVVSLLDVVFGAPNAVARAAAAAVSAALDVLPVTRLARLEHDCRRHSPYSSRYNVAWISIRPAELGPFRGWVEHGHIIAALASFHPSGYVREAAVAWLDSVSGGRELPFLLLRLNDWVGPVADRALAAVERRVTAQYADSIVDSLPLLGALAQTTRRDHRAIIEHVSTILREPAQGTALARGFRSSDRTVRRMCFRFARESSDAGQALLDEALRDPDPAIRLAAVSDHVATVGRERLESVLGQTYADPFAVVRRIAIDAAATRLEPSRAIAWLEKALLDPGRAVREIAWFHIGRSRPEIDLAAFYRDAVRRETATRKLTGALSGLRATGSADDAPLALGLLQHGGPSVRQAAMRAAAGLDAEHHLDRLLAMLRDSSRAVTRATAAALLPHAAVIGLDGIRAALRPPRPSHPVHAISLSLGLGKWSSLEALLEFTSDADDEVREHVAAWLTQWLARQNHSYTHPTPIQLDAIKRSLLAYAAWLDPRTHNEIAQTVAYWSR